MAIIESALSDHKQIYFEIKQYEPNPTLRVRYEAVNYQGLYQDMLNMDYINDEYIRLEEAILTAIKRNKMTKFKFLNAPKNDWINSEVINKINKRNLLWHQYKKNPDNTEIKEQFRKERTKTFKYIQKTKNEYYFKAFKNCDGKSSKMWQLINNLSNNKIKHNFVPSKLVEPSQGTITDPQAICEHFNIFFAEIGIFLASQLPSQKPNASTNSVQPNNINKLTKFEFTTVEEVKLIINNLKSNSSKGIDGISVKAIKCLKDPISECLTNCINRCLQEGYFPDSLKLAKITPIYKSGPKDDPGNYRPISVLPVVSKIFEKIMYQRLCSFLNSNSYLFQGQYGFRSKSNTLTATIDLITKLKTKIDQKHVAVGIFIDLKKAFDTVSHDILISKLIELGIDASALQLLRSYLTNRFQVVKIGQYVSSPKRVKCGVPQGSILGPLLFLVYINSLHKLGLKGHITLYADDTCLFYFGINIHSILQEAQKDLDLLQTWFSRNLLTINVTKTNYMIFSAKNKKIPNFQPLTINGSEINQVNTEKYLGLTLDNRLSWKPHIAKIHSKLSSLLGCVRSIVKCLPLNVRYAIYNTLIKPHIDYLIEVWGTACKTNLCKLQTAQNKLVKVLFNYNYWTSHKIIYKETKIMNISQIYKYKTCILIYKILNKDIHSRITFTKNLDIHKRNLRRAHHISIPKKITLYGEKNIRFEGAKMYNSLPNDIKSCQKISTFKKLLKCHILEDSQ
ncbi:unnamed protein product [Euphydryas editha]|uniref:Reverse transcriptase domain-containing protein n=1 Tax=Euphydryas editha TaxID=104508 RepID=A0AAU9T969_EUPED|nr:unnamed protein product [Euphydryas editha]